MDEPRIIEGGVAVDDRGRVTFCNDFDMSRVKRFYMLENHQEGFVRAWHGHDIESKWIVCVSGVAIIGVARMEWDVWAAPELRKITLKDADRVTLHPNGDVLYIPPGYANGHMNLVSGTRVLHFSDKTMEEAERDDYRFSADIHGWVWEVKER